MAANQYVGLFYMDENGQRDKRYDIVIEGKSRESSVASETKEGDHSSPLSIFRRGWIKYFWSTDGRFSTIRIRNIFRTRVRQEYILCVS